MEIYQVTEEGFQPLEMTNFTDAGFKEREHLPQLLKQQFDVIEPESGGEVGESWSSINYVEDPSVNKKKD